jgi:hypothetical protein
MLCGAFPNFRASLQLTEYRVWQILPKRPRSSGRIVIAD